MLWVSQNMSKQDLTHETMVEDLEFQGKRGAASFPDPEEVRASYTSRAMRDIKKPRKGRLISVSLWVILVIVLVTVPSLVMRGRGTKATSANFRMVERYFVDMGVSDASSFDDETSPQYRAALWLAAEQDGDLLLDARGSYFYLFRYVMAVNYYALGGDDWFTQLKFLTNEPVCKWKSMNFGILCYEVDGQELPLELVLPADNLRGTMVSELGKLTTLRRLDFSNNTLTGTIPTELCTLNDLTFLVLNHNGLSGSIPACLGTRTDLEDLWLSNNMLEGTLPLEIGNLINLENLYIDDNMMSGNPLPTLNKLTKLTHIMAGRNDFAATIDSTMFAKMTQLHWVDLSHNRFTSVGGFPGHLFNLKLNLLDLSRNQLAGPFPNVIAANTDLGFLSLHDNKLTGSLTSLSNLSGLIHLDLCNNTLSGSMDSISSLPKLALAFLSENPFTRGNVPDGFSKLVNLTELSLRNTNRDGKLPELAKQLRLLDLGSNQLTGAVPMSYGRHKRLTYMLLNNNSGIIGVIPDTFLRMTTLRGAFLDGTSLDNTTMNTMCKMRTFASVRHETDEVLIGDCNKCHCRGCQCCTPKLEGGCSRPLLDNLDATWESDFRRVAYDMRNFTADLERLIRPDE